MRRLLAPALILCLLLSGCGGTKTEEITTKFAPDPDLVAKPAKRTAATSRAYRD